MGKAERLAKQQIATRKRDEEARQRSDEAARLAAHRGGAVEIQALIPQALAALEATGWRGGRIIKVRGNFFDREKAGWKIAQTIPSGGGRFGAVSTEIFLLSDGRIWADGIEDASRLVQWNVREQAIAGLKRIIAGESA